MEKSITPNQIKEKNRNLIYRYIYKNKKVSQQDISYDLRLSRPTVTANLSALEEEGLIWKNGQIDTELVGRKAAAYSVTADYRMGIGVEILKNEIRMIAVDLYGERAGRMEYGIAYRDEEEYYRTVCRKILDFKESLGISDEGILGVGFAMQALISPDKKTVVYGEILSCTGLGIGEFTRYLPYDCSFIHDADGAAVSELWVSPELSDAFYLSISRHLGAAIIFKGEIVNGRHGHNSTIEHIQMKPEGERCYCGRYGCMETLCSLTALLGEGESLDEFFAGVRKGVPGFGERWRRFLAELARAVNLLHLVYDTDFILGGYLAPYLKEEDIVFLHDQIQEMTPFEESRDFLRVSKMAEDNIAVGAALPYIQGFLNKF